MRGVAQNTPAMEWVLSALSKQNEFSTRLFCKMLGIYANAKNPSLKYLFFKVFSYVVKHMFYLFFNLKTAVNIKSF